MTLDYNTMAERISSQILALQNSIANRAENSNIPTMQEVTMQVRLLGCLDKLQRFAARQAKEQAGSHELETGKKNTMPPPPLSEAFLQANPHMLNVASEDELDEIVEHPGGTNTRLWVVYNLLQHYAPVNKRMFIYEEAVVQERISKHEMMAILQEMQAHMAA